MDLCGSIGDEGGRSLGGSGSEGRLGSILVTQPLEYLTLLVLSVCRDGDVLNWSLKLQQRMGAVVSAVWIGFTGLTEVGVVADNTLVADSGDVLVVEFAVAEAAITIHTRVDDMVGGPRGKRQEQRYKPVSWMRELGVTDTASADVPVGTVDALVSGVDDLLVNNMSNNATIESGRRRGNDVMEQYTYTVTHVTESSMDDRLAWSVVEISDNLGRLWLL